jgi:trehalose 6-phosphate synthase
MVLRNSNRTWVINCPISVDYNSISNRIKEEKVIKEKERIQSNFGEVMLGVGVDRIDYTKGLIEKFDAIDRFFEKYPEYKEKVVFVQMAVLDKVRVREYEELGYKIDEMVDKINWKYGTDTWSPIEYIKARVPFDRVLAMYNKAKFCLISSLDDGLNIVSKEFVSAQNLNDPGVLLLSEFAGASQEFKNNGAIIINPYDTEHCADTIRQAIKMKDYERKSRMRKLKKIVQENDIFKWSYNIFRAFYSIAERK